jgi:hypothetical protein
MRLSNLRLGFCRTAAHFALALAVILLFSSNTVAQHSSGGGGSSGGSSSSGGGGGSHGGGSSGGGSSSSGGGHNSGGSGSSGAHSSGGHSSTGHGSSSGSSSSHSPRTGVRETHSDAAHSVHENAQLRGKTGPEKRGFFSLLRHPFRKPQPKPEPKLMVDLRRPICFRGPCAVCPTGIARGGAGCRGAVITNYAHRSCMAGAAWNGIACLEENHFPYDCNWQRLAMEQQEQRAAAAEAAQKNACSTDSAQDCSERTSASQNEISAYRTLQDQYRACQQRSYGMNPFGHAVSHYSHGLSSYPLDFDLEFDADYR